MHTTIAGAAQVDKGYPSHKDPNGDTLLLWGSNKTILTLRGHIWTAKSVGSDEVRAVAHSRRKLFSGFSSIGLQIDEVENNDGKESSPWLYLVFENNLR